MSIEFWKSHLASNHLTEFLTTLDRIRNEGEASSMLDDVLEIKWKTRGKNHRRLSVYIFFPNR